MTLTPGKKLAEDQWGRFESGIRDAGSTFFDGVGHITGARAPGRLDVLGGVSDYSGGTVLEATLADATLVATQRRPDRILKIHSEGLREAGLQETLLVELNGLIQGRSPVTFEQASALLTDRPEQRWSAYVAGCLYVLIESGLLPVERICGLNILVSSGVPVGAGVSSSAALEVASMLAMCGLLGVPVDGITLARLCQRTENRVVGAPCGIMDQMTTALGREKALLVLKCQPHDVLGHVPIPRGWKSVGIDSGIKHAVRGRRYRRARVAAFMGMKILQVLARDRWGGYLCNISPDAWNPWRERIPKVMSGADFLEKFHRIDDPVSAIDPDETYAIRDCAEHAIMENDRVRQFMALLAMARTDPDEQLLVECGGILLDAHASYSDRLDLGSTETDLLVKLAMDQGPDQGIYGAKITGGGSGGTVAVLCAGPDADQAIERIRRAYEQATGIFPLLMSGSSPGAIEFGARKIG